MTKITFIDANGTTSTVKAVDGDSVMQTARLNNISGIVAECGGAMACATCHAYVDDAWADRVGPVGEDESEMLDFASCEVKETSRLTCQIKIEPKLDGLVIRLPEEQL